MGVAMAYPLSHYETLDVEVVRLSDCREWPIVEVGNNKANEEGSKGKGGGFVWRVAGFMGGLFGKLKGFPTGLLVSGGGDGGTKTSDVKVETTKPLPSFRTVHSGDGIYSEAKRRSNILISATLKPKAGDRNATPFMVSTYHMPCAFLTPQLMILHVELAIAHSTNLAKNSTHKLSEGEEKIPHILAGDFNFMVSISILSRGCFREKVIESYVCSCHLIISLN